MDLDWDEKLGVTETAKFFFYFLNKVICGDPNTQFVRRRRKNI
jgi:hypothetical protein